MTNFEQLPATVLARKAVVYVRQSTQTQVQTNLESQRRQYDLVSEARRYGFEHIEVIDDDLGRSASGTVARPGFDRLVAWLGFAQAKLVPWRALTRLVWRVMAAIGITCWSCVV